VEAPQWTIFATFSVQFSRPLKFSRVLLILWESIVEDDSGIVGGDNLNVAPAYVCAGLAIDKAALFGRFCGR